MFKEASLKTGLSHFSFVMGREEIEYEPQDGRAGITERRISGHKSRLVAFIISALHHRSLGPLGTGKN